jgi:hypothetical protein
MSLRLVSWNIGHQIAAWHELAKDHELDVALLQEAIAPPAGATSRSWLETRGSWPDGRSGLSVRPSLGVQIGSRWLPIRGFDHSARLKGTSWR